MTDEVSPTRRSVLAGAGATVVVALTGCTVYDTSGGNKAAPPAAGASPGASPGPSGSPGGSAGGAAAPIAKAADIPVGGGVITQGIVVTQPTAGQFVGFSAICTHQGCTVGTVEKGLIECPCHGSAFRVADGSVANGPANRPLGKVAVTVNNGGIFKA